MKINKNNLKGIMSKQLKTQIARLNKLRLKCRNEKDFQDKIELERDIVYQQGFIDALIYVHYRIEEYDDGK